MSLGASTLFKVCQVMQQPITALENANILPREKLMAAEKKLESMTKRVFDIVSGEKYRNSVKNRVLLCWSVVWLKFVKLLLCSELRQTVTCDKAMHVMF